MKVIQISEQQLDLLFETALATITNHILRGKERTADFTGQNELDSAQRNIHYHMTMLKEAVKTG